MPPVRVAADAAGLADQAAQLLDDPAARARLGTDARAFVQAHHSPRAYAQRLTQTYEVAVERHRRRTTGATQHAA